jgi:hypothetical protein
VRPYFLACVVDCIADCVRLAMMNPCGAAAIVNLRFLRRYPAFVIFSEIGAVKFSKIFEEDRDIRDPRSSLRCRANQIIEHTLATGGASPKVRC